MSSRRTIHGSPPFHKDDGPWQQHGSIVECSTGLYQFRSRYGDEVSPLAYATARDLVLWSRYFKIELCMLMVTCSDVAFKRPLIDQ